MNKAGFSRLEFPTSLNPTTKEIYLINFKIDSKFIRLFQSGESQKTEINAIKMKLLCNINHPSPDINSFFATSIDQKKSFCKVSCFVDIETEGKA